MTTSDRYLLCDRFGAVLRITINRPDRLNALSYGPGSVHEELHQRCAMPTATTRCDASW